MARRTVADSHHVRGDLDLLTRIRIDANRRFGRIAAAWTETIELLRRFPVIGPIIAILSAITPLGWGVTGSGVALSAAGLIGRWVEVLVIGFVCLLLIVVALAWSAGRAGHAIGLELGRVRVTVGERALGALTVSNPTPKHLRPTIVELKVGAGANTFLCPSLAPNESHEEVFGISTTRRSIVEVGPASTVRGDALGLVRRVQHWSESTQLYIHPKTIQMTASSVGFIRDIEGATTQDLSSADVSFHALRDYIPGDDRRNIHWRTTARVGKLMVRQFEETRRSHLLIVLDLDTDAWANEDEFETGVSAAASLARATLIESKQVSIYTQVGMLKTPTPMHAMDSLSGVEQVFGAERLSSLARKAGVEVPQASTAVLITGSATPVSELHAGLNRLPLNMLIAGVRIDPSAPFDLRSLGSTPIATVPRLEDFAVAMWKALG